MIDKYNVEEFWKKYSDIKTKVRELEVEEYQLFKEYHVYIEIEQKSKFIEIFDKKMNLVAVYNPYTGQLQTEDLPNYD